MLKMPFFIVLIYISIQYAKSEETLSFEMLYADFPPFTMPGETGPSGILANLVIKMVDDAGVKVKFINIPTERFIRLSQAGMMDIMVSSKSLANEQYYHVAEQPLLSMGINFFWHKSTPPIRSLEEIKDRRLAIMNGFFYDGYIDKINNTPGLKIIKLRRHSSALKMLLNDRVEYVLDYDRMFNTISKTMAHEIESIKLHDTKLYLCVRKDLNHSMRLYTRLLGPYNNLIQSGEKEKIIKEYMEHH